MTLRDWSIKPETCLRRGIPSRLPVAFADARWDIVAMRRRRRWSCLRPSGPTKSLLGWREINSWLLSCRSWGSVLALRSIVQWSGRCADNAEIQVRFLVDRFLQERISSGSHCQGRMCGSERRYTVGFLASYSYSIVKPLRVCGIMRPYWKWHLMDWCNGSISGLGPYCGSSNLLSVILSNSGSYHSR